MNESSTLRADVTTMSLVGLAHGTSHFFHLLLPPLFPFFIDAFGLSYAQLGLLVTVFFILSGVGQALSGFVVDRIGARPVLWAAMGFFTLAGLVTSAAQGYGWLLAAAALAGIGNAPFHPADFTILNKRVSPARLGHAFSVHGITGNLGWAAAPVFSAGLLAVTGSWRMAAAATGVWALLVLVVLVWQREAINDRATGAVRPASAASAAATPAHGDSSLAFLKLPSVWLCFSFFFWTTCALSAIQSFASPALQSLYGLPLGWTSMVVTGYMLCGAAGMVLGGFLVGQAQRLERIIAVCMLSTGVALALVGTGWLPGHAALVLTVLAGLGTGIAGPSRDMLIKRAAPPGATGRVYGTVYSGLDTGFALAAPVFGALMDRGLPGAVFLGASLAMVAGVGSAAWVGIRLWQARQATAPQPT